MVTPIDLPEGFKLHHYSSVSSTNDIIENLLQEQHSESGLVVLADEQTAGKGRKGRKWISQKGNLFMSIALLKQTNLPDHQLVFLAGVAVLDVLRVYGDKAKFHLKWPNDILYNRVKCGGILCKTLRASGHEFYIIGLGLNLTKKPILEDRDTTAIQSTLTFEQYAEKIIASIYLHYCDWIRLGFTRIKNDWIHYSVHSGQKVRIAVSNDIIEGNFKTITDTGELVLHVAELNEIAISNGDIMEY
jgi:BirA family biotin operon repressor/biotin-[acetyl-CoA-carboxylase] ligase